MKSLIFVFLILSASALAQSVLPQYEFPKLDSAQLDSMWMLGTFGATGEIEWRYVNPGEADAHCNVSRGLFYASGFGDVHIQTAEYNPSRDGIPQFTTAELSPGMGDMTFTPAVLSIEEARVDAPASFTGRTHVYYKGARMELFGEVAQSFGLKIGSTITDEALFWNVLAANSSYGLQEIRAAIDTLPPQTPTITVMPNVGTESRTIKSDYSGEEYRAGTGHFYDPSGTLGDTTYLIDYKGSYPSIYQLSRIDTKPQPTKYLFFFKNQKKAQLTTELVGLGLIVAGGALGGKAEYYSRYHGTTSNWDSFHITRDAGLLTTGAGCTLLGASFALDDDLKVWEVACKLVLSAIMYRASAEAVYGFMD